MLQLLRRFLCKEAKVTWESWLADNWVCEWPNVNNQGHRFIVSSTLPDGLAANQAYWLPTKVEMDVDQRLSNGTVRTAVAWVAGKDLATAQEVMSRVAAMADDKFVVHAATDDMVVLASDLR